MRRRHAVDGRSRRRLQKRFPPSTHATLCDVVTPPLRDGVDGGNRPLLTSSTSVDVVTAFPCQRRQQYSLRMTDSVTAGPLFGRLRSSFGLPLRGPLRLLNAGAGDRD